jgi:outer membrane lipoprotein carrier protein
MRYLASMLSILFFVSLQLSAQEDPESISILDRFSENALHAPSVMMHFKLATTNQTDDSKDTLSGSVLISKDKYKLELPDNIIWFNGVTSWSYLPYEKEVTITRADKKDNSFQSKPSLIFTTYKKGYKTRLIEEKANSYVIDLYPEDIKGELLRIRLTIGKSKLNLITLEYKKRDGTIITLHVTEYNLTVKPEPLTFEFQPESFKDVEVIDMR